MRAPRKRGSREKADPCTMVIFGGAGDLTKRKLIPAIYYLAEQKLLPDNFALLGVARDANTDEGYRAIMREAMNQSDEIHKSTTTSGSGSARGRSTPAAISRRTTPT
jgi:glucose-6-phosphate 1-dehydrogenase